MPRLFREISQSDERGWIRDLVVGDGYALTEIFTKRNAVRGNHLHRRTIQWTKVIKGALLVAEKGLGDELPTESVLRAGDFFVDPPAMAHAWRALEDTTVLVFTRGPRSGDQYESDTERLAEPMLS